MTRLTQADCVALDQNDALREFRDEFIVSPEGVYLDGNSLGLLTHAARDRVRTLVEQEWAIDAVQAWHKRDWVHLPERLGARLARLVGAHADEVTVADSTSVNLFKLAVACCRANAAGKRRKIVTELGNFPTDLYILQGLTDLLGSNLELRAVPREQVLNAIDGDTALVVLTHVHYKSADMFDMAAVTRLAHQHGALMLWDLCHSVGALPVDLGGADVDVAVGCGYKYLNGGPGAPAFLYVKRELHGRLQPSITGWMGHADPFEFGDDYRPAADIRRHRSGTPGVLGLAALDGSLSVFDRVDMQAVRHKSVRLTELFIQLVEQECAGHGLSLATPRDAAKRGSHVSFQHDHGYEIMRALIARNVVGDFRAPDAIRFGFTPLYIRHVDVWSAVAALRNVLETGAWQQAEYKIRHAVT